MNIRGILAGAALAALAASQAGALTVFNVSAPKINCVFNPTCTVTVNDSTGDLTFTPLGAGAFMQSRTYPGRRTRPQRAAPPTCTGSI